MLRLWMTLICVAIVNSAAFGEELPSQSKEAALNTTAAQASYGIGLSIGRQLQADGLEIDVNALTQALKDVFTGAQPRLTEGQVNAALRSFQEQMIAKNAEKQKQIGEKNKQQGQAFLTANKKKDGVVTLESGLQYKVLKRGAGAKPTVNDTVRTHYHGTLLDGTVFDSSVERKEPAVFQVGGVIRGWTEALQRMTVGSKWRLFVPPELAYGTRGAGPDIGPHAVLIFDVELLGIE